MKTILLLIVIASASIAASAQTPVTVQTDPPQLKAEQVSWEPIYPSFDGGNMFGQGGGGGRGGRTHPTPLPGNRLSYRSSGPAGASSGRQFGSDAIWWRAAARITNDTPTTIKSIRMAFVFTDANTGAEVLRIMHRSKKRLKSGKSYLYHKTVKSSRAVRNAKGAQLRIEITEVVYRDGTVWRTDDANKPRGTE